MFPVPEFDMRCFCRSLEPHKGIPSNGEGFVLQDVLRFRRVSADRAHLVDLPGLLELIQLGWKRAAWLKGLKLLPPHRDMTKLRVGEIEDWKNGWRYLQYKRGEPPIGSKGCEAVGRAACGKGSTTLLEEMLIVSGLRHRPY